MNELILDNPGLRALESGPRQDAVTLFRYSLGAVWNKRWLAVVVTAVIFAIVAAVAMTTPRHYAEAMLVIHPEHDNLAQPAQAQADLLSDSAVDTEVEILRSPAIAESVARKLRLYQDPEFGGSPDSKPTDEVIQKIATTLVARTRVHRVGLTYAIQVGFVASTVAEAKRIDDGIVSAYMSRKMDQKLAAVSRANHELGQALGGLRDQALRAESRVEEYVAKNDLLNADGTSLTETELSALNQRIADAEADSAEKEARVSAALTQARHGGGGSDVGATLASHTIGALREKEADVSSTLAQLEAQFGPDYPQVQKTQAELQDIRRQIQSETDRIVSSLRADADAAGRREASLLSSRQQVEGEIESNNRARVGLLTLRQASDSAKTIYDTYLKRASEVTAERGLQQVDATVEAKATAKTTNPFSSLSYILGGGFIVALIGGILAVLFSDMWTPRIRSLHDVSRETRLPLAGIVPDVSVLSHAENAVSHIEENPMTVVAESYRNLVAYLTVGRAHPPKVIASTSAVPGEGKTMLSICLARTLAASGSKVVLLDCDLRHASASEFFPRTMYGIAEVIQQSVPLERALVRDGRRGIWFLSGFAGKTIPLDLFGRDKLVPLLDKLAEQFDHIVIDTPPILGSADSRILISKADQVLYLVEWNKTPTSVVRAAVDVLRQCNASVAGVVLNKVNIRQQALYGFADGSDYYHRYGAAYPQVA